MLHLPNDALDLLLGDGLYEALAEAVEAPPPRHRHRLHVAEVEQDGGRDRDDGHRARRPRPREAPQRRPRHERLCLRELVARVVMRMVPFVGVVGVSRRLGEWSDLLCAAVRESRHGGSGRVMTREGSERW